MRDPFSFDGFPRWLEDETLFSLVSRYHRLTGHSSPKHTAKILFGSAMSGYQHDFPSGIDHFVGITQGQRGTSDEIIRRRTILPFFLAFRSGRDERNAYTAMRGPRIGNLKYQLGLLTSRFRAHHPLRACLTCMAQDREMLGTAYWRRGHQYPAVLICVRHQMPLFVSIIKTTGVRRFDYFLPKEEELECARCGECDYNDDQLKTLTRFAECAVEIGNMDRRAAIQPGVFQSTCANRLQEMNLLTESGRLRLTEAAKEYQAFVQPLSQIGELSGLPSSLSESKLELGRMIRGSRGGTHPLRYVAIMLWLFDDWRSFVKKTLSASAAPYSHKPTLGIETDKKAISGRRQQQFLLLVQSDGLSVTRAARHVGVDVAVALRWAAESGVNTSRRTKRIRGPLLANIVDDINRGKDRAHIAKARGVSVSTVARVIYSTPGLMAIWKQSRFDLRLKEYRAAWLELVKSHGQIGRKLLRSMSPKTYAWLYRNDIAWLRHSMRDFAVVKMGNNASVDWMQRDSDLANVVERAAVALRNNPTVPRITLGLLCQSLPQLKPRLSQLGKLPMTKRALNIAINKKDRSQDNASVPFDE